MASKRVGRVMNKEEWSGFIADVCGTTKMVAKDVFDAIVGRISENLADGNRVAVAGLGTFEVRSVAARKGRNPRTGEKVDVYTIVRGFVVLGGVDVSLENLFLWLKEKRK